MTSRTRLKLLLTAGAVAVATSLLFVAAEPIAAEYEISVYESQTAPFWFLLLVGILLGQAVVFESATPDGRHRYWKWGFALLIAANAVLLLLPALRYHLYARGDMLTFIGMIREIEALGVVPRSNYYPNLHLLTLTLSYVTGVEITGLVNLLPPLFSILYVVSLYELLNVLFADERTPLYVLPFGALLLFKFENVLFSPNVAAFMMVPFVLYLLFRKYTSANANRFEIPFLVVIVSIVFFHPITTIFLVGIFVLLKLTFVVGRRVADRNVGRENAPLITASLAFVVFFSWYYSFDSIIGSTTLLLAALFGLSGGSPEFAQISLVFGRANPELTDVALVGLYTYGLFAALFGLAGVFVGYNVYAYVTGRREFDAVEAFLSAVFVAFTVAGVAAFFVDFRFGSTRFLRYVRLSGSILIGIGFFGLFRRADFLVAKRYLRPMIYVSFFVFAFLSVFMLYGSPISNDRNLQVTEAEIEGMSWLFDHRDTSLLIDELGINQYRLYNFDHHTREQGRNVRWGSAQPPDHFAYQNASALDQSPSTFPQSRYLVVTRLGRIQNPEFYPEYRQHWRHTPEDFERLENDSSVAHVYDDGGLDAYLVQNVGGSTNNSTNTD